MLKNIYKYPKNISMNLKNLKNHFKKLQKYYGLDYLFNESTRQNSSINVINDVKTLFNERRNNLSRQETKRIRKKLRRMEAVYNVLKEKEQKGRLTSRQKNI